jgi:hypothetical protein
MKRFQLLIIWSSLMLMCMTACVSPQRNAKKPPLPTQSKEPVTAQTQPVPANLAPAAEQKRAMPPSPAPQATAPEPENLTRSLARDAKEYRKDAAKHIYQKFPHKIYTGKLPPLLKAVAVLDVVIGPDGRVLEMIWSRPPSHVPEVMADIENMVRGAGPFPAPVHLRKVVYTETWLWHSSNRFQLDTLTEGQK